MAGWSVSILQWTKELCDVKHVFIGPTTVVPSQLISGSETVDLIMCMSCCQILTIIGNWSCTVEVVWQMRQQKTQVNTTVPYGTHPLSGGDKKIVVSLDKIRQPHYKLSWTFDFLLNSFRVIFKSPSSCFFSPQIIPDYLLLILREKKITFSKHLFPRLYFAYEYMNCVIASAHAQVVDVSEIE